MEKVRPRMQYSLQSVLIYLPRGGNRREKEEDGIGSRGLD